MIHLSGLTVKGEDNPDGDIEIKYTGLRPGEKLYEELLIGENVSGSAHPRIMTANEMFLPWSQYKTLMDRLDDACHDFDHSLVRDLLLEAPTAFTPSSEIKDLVFTEAKLTGNVLPIR